MDGVTVGEEVTDELQVVMKDTEFEDVLPLGHVTAAWLTKVWQQVTGAK
jgi:hypothetical protein